MSKKKSNLFSKADKEKIQKVIDAIEDLRREFIKGIESKNQKP